MHCHRLRRHHYGFTLLEVLIALSIFSMIGLSTHHVLQLAISSDAGAEAGSEALSGLQRAVFLIGNDLEQVADRPVRDSRSEWTGALVANHGAYLLEFTRLGWRNPLQLPRSNLQRVAYALESFPDSAAPGRYTYSLLRYHWRVRERAPDTRPQATVLLENVLDARFRFLDRKGVWRSSWPGAGAEALPLAVQVDIERNGAGVVRRVFQTGDP